MGKRENPASSTNTIVLPSCWAFFSRGPSLIFPGRDGLFVSLGGPFDWLLHTVLDPFEQPTHMRRMVAHAKLLVDEHCHTLCRPDGSCLRHEPLLPAGASREAAPTALSSDVLLAQRRFFRVIPLSASSASHLHPLAHRTLRHSQRFCDLLLAPSLLAQVPCSASAPLFPISSLLVCSSHSSILSYFSKLSRAQ
jgi:hypothetical protein